MIKLVKNPQGEVVAFGSHEGYEPSVPNGYTLEEVEIYTPTLSVAERKAIKQAEISALEAKAYMRRGQREDWLVDKNEKLTAAGVTHAQVYGVNPEYTRVYDENVLATKLRAELKAIV